MIKAIFFDADGTLLNSQSKLLDSTILALNKLKEKGILTVVATGRSLAEFKIMDVYNYDFDAYILANGAIAYNHDYKIIYDEPFNEDIRLEMVKIFNEKKIPLMLVEEERIYQNFINDATRHAWGVIHMDPPKVDEYKGDKIYQALTYVDDLDNNLDAFPKDLNYTRWNNKAVDILANNNGKIDGIKKFCKIYNIDLKDTASIGDGDNDIEMLEGTGLAIAMGNAKEKLKEIADYITDDLDNDGIYKALINLDIIDK